MSTGSPASPDTAAAAAAAGRTRELLHAPLLPTLLRGHALGLAGRMPPLVRALWRHAAGV